MSAVVPLHKYVTSLHLLKTCILSLKLIKTLIYLSQLQESSAQDIQDCFDINTCLATYWYGTQINLFIWSLSHISDFCPQSQGIIWNTHRILAIAKLYFMVHFWALLWWALIFTCYLNGPSCVFLWRKLGQEHIHWIYVLQYNGRIMGAQLLADGLEIGAVHPSIIADDVGPQKYFPWCSMCSRLSSPCGRIQESIIL